MIEFVGLFDFDISVLTLLSLNSNERAKCTSWLLLSVILVESLLVNKDLGRLGLVELYYALPHEDDILRVGLLHLAKLIEDFPVCINSLSFKPRNDLVDHEMDSHLIYRYHEHDILLRLESPR